MRRSLASDVALIFFIGSCWTGPKLEDVDCSFDFFGSSSGLGEGPIVARHGQARLLGVCGAPSCRIASPLLTGTATNVLFSPRHTSPEDEHQLTVQSSNPEIANTDPIGARCYGLAATLRALRPGNSTLVLMGASSEIDEFEVEVADAAAFELRKYKAPPLQSPTAELVAEVGDIFFLEATPLDANGRVLAIGEGVSWYFSDVSLIKPDPGIDDAAPARSFTAVAPGTLVVTVEAGGRAAIGSIVIQAPE